MRSSVTVDLHSRSFLISHRGVEQRFGIPDSYDIRTSDLKEILGVAHSIVGSEPNHWWELHAEHPDRRATLPPLLAPTPLRRSCRYRAAQPAALL
jgi:hypothetical protein